MSERGLEFAERWVSENVQATVYATEDGPSAEAEEALRQLFEDASEEGISREEMEEDIGDLGEYVRSAFAEAADAELDRLIDDD